MRADDVELGQTYRVDVPAHPGPGEEDWVPTLWLLGGDRFSLTVTRVDRSAACVLVEGLRVVHTSTATVELTPEQVHALGLPRGDYRVTGRVARCDGATISIPEVSRVRVPLPWLGPPEE